jgi:hypothetical protein
MTIIDDDPQPRYDPEFEHTVIQPLLVLFLRGGIAPANEIILHKNAVERGLMKLDLFGNVEFTEAGEKVLDEYTEYTRRFTFY